MANKLNKLFFSKEIKKVYIAITKGVPNPNEGIICKMIYFAFKKKTN